MKPSAPNYYLGVDVCKAKLDVFFSPWPKPRSFANTTKGIRNLFAELKSARDKIQIVCEATGGYEKTLLEEAHDAGIAISLVNALKVRHFAAAKGQLAKTDAIDAQTIAEYAEVFKPVAQHKRSEVQTKLSAAVRRKDSLVRQLTREKNAKEKALDRFVKADLKAGIRNLEGRIARFEKQIQELINSDPAMSEKKSKLEKVKGIGPAASALLLAELPELGSISDKKASCLVGVAPLNRDSGTWRGQRTIHGGRGLVRRGLYMPALSAITHNPILSAFYRGLVARNKAHHVAITAVMRKLICVLNRVLADPEFELS